MAFESEKILTGKLRSLIKERGYNFAEFAREVDISKEAMRTYTSEKVPVSSIKPENLRVIAGKLGVPINALRPAGKTFVEVPATHVAIVVPVETFELLALRASQMRTPQTVESLVKVFAEGTKVRRRSIVLGELEVPDTESAQSPVRGKAPAPAHGKS